MSVNQMHSGVKVQGFKMVMKDGKKHQLEYVSIHYNDGELYFKSKNSQNIYSFLINEIASIHEYEREV